MNMKENSKQEQQENQAQHTSTSKIMETTRFHFDLTDNQLLTPADKLHVMANKNPDIELLIKEFNLQII